MELLHNFQILLSIQKYVHHRSKLLAVFSTYFEEHKLLHCHDTRQKNDFHTYAVQSTIGKKTTRYRGSKLWNNLPHDLKNTTSLLSFTHRLIGYLLQTLEQQLSEYIIIRCIWLYQWLSTNVSARICHLRLHVFFCFCTFFLSMYVYYCFVMGGQLRWANAFTGSLPL